MTDNWKKDFWYTVLRKYVQACARMGYRHVTVTGLDKVPSDGGSIIFASKHCTALMDPLVLMMVYDKPVSFGARADIFRKPAAGKFLRWVKMLPLARERDGKQAVTGNYSIFNEAVQNAENGIPFCLYPEGTHYPDYEVHPLRKGVGRLGLLAAETNPKGAWIIPVGLVYGSFYDYMSDVRINFGEPIAAVPGDDPKELRDKVQESLEKLVYEPSPEKGMPAILKYCLAVLLIPVFVLCAALTSPILIVEAILVARLEDKAWTNTVRFCCSLLFFVLWPFHSLFHLILNFYKSILK